ncbi:hypothetical protein BH11PSE11_BH11PSE11_26090 [soil metagenome]
MPRLAMNVLWPSFLVAIIAEGCFFSLFDPSELYMHVSAMQEWTPLAGYTMGFFFFWLCCALASLLSSYLIIEPDD